MAEELIRQINPDAEIVCDGARIRPVNSEVNRLLGSNDRLRALTGWEPEWSFTEGIRETVGWFREHKNYYKGDLYNI